MIVNDGLEYMTGGIYRELGPDQTELTLQVSFPESMSEARAAEWLDSGMREGWAMTIDRLVDRLA